jgi:hypothetical protein
VATQKRVEPILIAHGKLKGAVVSRNDEDFPHTVEQYRASPANRKMLLNLAAQFVIQVAINVGGEALG